jgi:DAK2 domain fusion protein YloV
MLLTMRAAYKRIRELEESNVGRVAGALSQGALMGARGNSGVILSQIWRGLARVLADKATFDAPDLAKALQLAAETAYKGVMRPVEGTILTVIREGAEEAQDAVSKSHDLRFVLERVLERSQQALARTPEMLPVLKEAGVVDAGGQGLVFIFAGMLRYVHGEVVKTVEAPDIAFVPAQVKAAPKEGLENPYDVQFILMGENLDVAVVRDTIDHMGDSTVVVGDETAIKVHIHVKDPGVPLSYGTSLGRIADVVVENMQLQMEEIINRARPRLDQPASIAEEEAGTAGHIGVVAVAAGGGLADIFRSLGATGIVNGGQSNNPSTEEIYHAIEALPTEKVIVLPNNKNIILAAEAARDLSAKQVAVVPTLTVPQGISALLSLNQEDELQNVVQAMERASQHVASGEITVATRSVVLDGIAVQEGQVIGVADGHLCAAEADVPAVLPQVLEKLDVADRELVSIYYGRDVTEADAQALAQQIEALYSDLEIEILAGGQAIYHYILGVE